VSELALYLRTASSQHVPLRLVWPALGYLSGDAARKAFARGKGPLPSYDLPGRRGRFVSREALLQWLELAERRMARSSNA
jgi:hypothetical protein